MSQEIQTHIIGVITFGLCDVCGSPATHVVRDSGVVIGSGCGLHPVNAANILKNIPPIHNTLP